MEIIREFNWCKQYNMDYIRVVLNGDSITIIDSYKIKKRKHLKEVIKWIRTFDDAKLLSKPLFLHVNEWRYHNLLHLFNEYEERRRHLLLCKGQNLIHKISHTIFSLFYWGF